MSEIYTVLSVTDRWTNQDEEQRDHVANRSRV